MTLPHVHQVAGYLAAKGWEITGSWRGADVWTRDEFDVLLPPDDGSSDAAPRIRDLLVCVADAEERDPFAVAREMVMPGSDVVSYRVALPEFTAVTLGTGLRAVRTVRHLITTCARAAADELPGADLRAPDRLVERTSLSTADLGFGFDVFVPVHQDTVQQFGRATTTRLLSAATAALVDGAHPSGDLDDMPSALADLAGEHHESPFDLAFRWATALPANQEDVSLHFPGDFAAKVRGRREKAAPPAAVRGVVQGRVTRLAHDGPRRMVTIRGALHLDGRPAGRERAVRVRVDDQETYLAAVEAHAAELRVRAEGRAESTGAKHVIVVEPDGFTVVDRERG